MEGILAAEILLRPGYIQTGSLGGTKSFPNYMTQVDKFAWNARLACEEQKISLPKFKQKLEVI